MTTIHHVLAIVNAMTDKPNNVTLYTDCKNFIDLIERRQYNENIFVHRNYEFYKILIDLVKKNNVTLKWTKGHSKKSVKEKHDVIFTLVDKQARKQVRQII